MLNIYSVNWYSNHFLEANYQLFKQMNPDLEFRWLVCDHNPPGIGEIVPHDEIVVFNRQSELRGQITQARHVGMGSVAHGNGLNFLIDKSIENEMEADWNWVLDPDFYVVQPIQPILDHITTDCFGGTYWPQDGDKIKRLWGYPGASNSIFGPSVDFSELDFRSDYPKHELIDGYRPDVGYKVVFKMLRGEMTYEAITDYQTYRGLEVYYFDGMLYGFHIHMKRWIVGAAKMQDEWLRKIGLLHKQFKIIHNPDVDWSFIDNIQPMISEWSEKIQGLEHTE